MSQTDSFSRTSDTNPNYSFNCFHIMDAMGFGFPLVLLFTIGFFCYLINIFYTLNIIFYNYIYEAVNVFLY